MFELARHLTERDREIALRLYDQQVLTTEQLRLLFFTSKRRAQDRLLFLYRHRIVDRFYPPSPFGAGKPEAHWLLDEGGAILVAAMLGAERKQLGWQRRDDWASHPQLAHRLELNRFVTDLIAATLTEPTMGVTAWYSSRDAAARLGVGELLRPDAGFILDVPAGPIECYLEWDRGTETRSVLMRKLDGYRLAEGRLHDEPQLCNVLFVAPGRGRIETLRHAYDDFAPKRERHRQSAMLVDLDGRWPLLAATVPDLRREGPLGAVWESIVDPREPRRALTELPARSDLGSTDLGLALGRRWRIEQPGFWDRLSPLHRQPATEAALRNGVEPPTQPTPADDPETEAYLERLRRRRQDEAEELQRELAARRGDLPPSGTSGLIHDPEDEEGPWQ